MQIRYHCPFNGCVAIIEYEPLEDCSGSICCPRCHEERTLTITDKMRDRKTVDRCAVCDAAELFVRKDFPQGLGLLIVVVFGLSAVYCFTFSVVFAWAVLTCAALLDLIIYAAVGRVTTCYACRAEYRKGNLNPDHEGFDLATSEKY